MKKYRVTIPLAGHIIIDTEAPDNMSEKEIYEKATEEIDWHTVGMEADSLEAIECYCEGNVCYVDGPWKYEVEELKDE